MYDSAFWIFFGFGFIWPWFVSVRGASFDIRISDLFFGILVQNTFLKIEKLGSWSAS